MPTVPLVFEAVRVPAQVDQPQWLIRLLDDTLALLEQERWAGPLRDELHQALLEIFVLRYGAVEARSLPQASAPAWVLRIDVTRFESTPSEARVDSSWTLAPRGSASAGLRCMSYFREPANGGLASVAAAHRRIVERLADAIGEQLLALQRGEAGRCPG